jgi:Na+-translocating ferredoxin:NAD+ oxidoreductase RnfD subunit
MNTLKLLGAAFANNLVPLLFLVGLIFINTACYIQWGTVTGLIVTGITLVIVAIIMVSEKNQQPPQ